MKRYARTQSKKCSCREKAAPSFDECGIQTLGRLRNRQLNGFKFVRQEPIGDRVADFVCREARLVVEVDGATHSTDEEMRKDATRTAALEHLGYKVIRIQNDDVYNAMEGVLNTILAALTLSR